VIYLDHNASNLIAPDLLAAHLAVLRSFPANAGSPHSAGRAARALIETARESLAAAFGFDRGEVTFCASGTEALNLAIMGCRSWRRGDHILASAIEHKAVLEPCKHLKDELGVELELLPVSPSGLVNLDELRARLRAETRLVAVMAANNETGVVQPLGAVRAALSGSKALLLVDGVQAAGRVPIPWELADLLVVSAHKLRAPKGAAALLARSKVEIKAQLLGGSQERGRRSGTEDTAAIASLGEAVRRLGTLFDLAGLRAARDAFERRLSEAIPGLVIHGQELERLPQTSSLRLPGLEAEALIALLDLQGIMVSAGSACTSGSLLPSHVLLAMGMSVKEARRTIRVSFGPETSRDELMTAADAIAILAS
jgi:cysteine desulfurase